MALKKPSDFFVKEIEGNNFPVVETDSGLRDELIKVENLSEQISQLQQELTQKVIKNDLESLVLSQINKMQENFDVLQTEFVQLNQKDINKFSEKISELTEIVNNLVETEIPKYKKKITRNELFINEQVSELQQSVDENITEIREEIGSKFQDIAEVVDNNIDYFNQQLQETSSQVKKTTETYTNLSKIVESRISRENEQLEQYSQVIEDIQKGFNELQQSLTEKVSVSQEVIEEKFVEYQQQLEKNTEEKLNTYQKEFKGIQINLETSVHNRLKDYQKDLSEVKADVVINEQHIKKVDKYLQDHYQELLNLKEEVFNELEKLPVGNLQENIQRLEKKIDFIKETYSKIEPEVVVKEVIQEGLLNEPPSTNNKDPLTPIDQNYVTLDQLQQHYRLFLNRIQQQLSTIGGGGETQLKYLDDIVGIATNASAYDGKYLKYNHSLGKFEFSPAEVAVDSIILGTDTTGDYVQSVSGTENQIAITGGTGESSTPVLSLTPSVTITNNLIVGAGASIAGVVTASSFIGNASSATYASVSGVSTSVIGGIGSITSLSVSGVTTTGTLNVGVGGTIITTTGIGSVGIGTTNPTQKLDVNGNTRITGTLNFPSRVSGTYIDFGAAGTLSATAGGVWLSFSSTLEAFGSVRSRGTFGLIGPTGIENAYIERDDANIIAQRNAGVAQTFRVYNTYTSSTNFERANLGWSNNNFIVGTEKGSSIGTARNLYLQTDGTTAVAITTTGSVGIGTTNPQYKLEVLGSFAATTKSFVIPHPTKQGKKLCYASLEGPENGVYVRGRTQSSVIELPDYWTGLVDHESITVNLTPIGESALPRVKEVANNRVLVFTKEEGELDYYYTVYAERKDVDKLEVEI